MAVTVPSAAVGASCSGVTLTEMVLGPVVPLRSPSVTVSVRSWALSPFWELER